MNTAVSVLFYIKRSKANNDGICPFYVRVTILTKRFEFSSISLLIQKDGLMKGRK
ncbi:hypothetical protein [Flavobacterium caseinilyticum]|uniref:hypothetical protein n=1 Tax=Flavobacterium caseinilyticum TaxID=2541732 RepID=UPI001404E003|nr:hypothetical protein [Flavobacterium caseinilyticum]